MAAHSTYDQILADPSKFRNSLQIRTSRDLPALANPESSYMQSLWGKAHHVYKRSLQSGVFSSDVTGKDFEPYTKRVASLLSELLARQQEAAAAKQSESRAFAHDQIPEEFFSPEFRLEEAVVSYSEIETLSEYLDMADLTIFSRISQKWQQFLGASQFLETVQSDIGELRGLVQRVQESGSGMEAGLFQKLCRIVRAQRRLQNTRQVLEYLTLVQAVRQTGSIVKDLLTTEQYAKATHLIVKTQQTLTARLKGVKSVRNERAQLEEIKLLVARMVDEELNKYTVGLLVTSVFAKVSGMVEALTAGEPEITVSECEIDSDRAETLIRNKLNTGTLSYSLLQLKHLVTQNVASSIQSIGFSLNVKSDEEWTTVTHRNLRLFLKTCNCVCRELFMKQEKLGFVILGVLGGSVSSDEYPEAKLKLKDTSGILIQNLQDLESSLFAAFSDKFQQILQSRRELLLSSPLQEIQDIYAESTVLGDLFSKLFKSGQEFSLAVFIREFEHQFLTNFHRARMLEMQSILEQESWHRVAVSQEMLQMIEQNRQETARACKLKVKSPDFVATDSLLLLYRMIYQYLEASEVLNKTSESGALLAELIGFYNKTTWRLIVGGTATRLKTISAKHLGLSAQGISFIIEELPYVQQRLTQKGLSNPISKKELQSHLEEIYKRIASIILDRAQTRCDQVAENWSQQTTHESYYAQIANDAVSMLSILQTVLTDSQIQRAFRDILSGLGRIFIDFYGKVDISSSVPALRVKTDAHEIVRILQDKLPGSLQEYVEDLADGLGSIVSIRCHAYLELDLGG